MKVKDLLRNHRIVQISPKTTALDAARLMAKAHVGALLVTTEGQAEADKDKLLGIFTERDLMVRIVAKDLAASTTRVEEVMTTDLFTTTPETSLIELQKEMRARHIRHVPVLKDGAVLAVLSMRDLMRAALREKGEEVDHMTNYIQGSEFA